LRPSKASPTKWITSSVPALMASGAGDVHHAGAADGVTEDDDRLSDDDRAEVAELEHIDLAAGTGLGQRRGEGQARRYAGARIGIAAQVAETKVHDNGRHRMTRTSR
jgi:hypothetical protein